MVDSLVITTTRGAVSGSDDSNGVGTGAGTRSWKGIPFAKPPVGELRWMPPVDPVPWAQVRAATEFGNASAQNGRLYGPGANNRFDETIGTTLNTPVGSEDCLYLNIWRPASDAQGLPVIVFVHGGSNISGYTADPLYDAANLARAANAVVVTVNYRLDIFGFFNLAQLKTGDPIADSGNFALLDVVQSLKFVQREIAAFGGDASNVTLMGQSAGAINVWALLASPLAKGLFHKAVPMSGGISLVSNLPPGSFQTLNVASLYAAQGSALLGHMLVAAGRAADAAGAAAHAATLSNAEVAAFMRSQSAAALLSTTLAKGLVGSGPIPDGTVVPTDVIGAIAAGNYHAVPILASTTRDEGKLFPAWLPLLGGPPGMIVSDAVRFKLMTEYDPEHPTLTDADLINPAYLPVDKPETGYDAVTHKFGESFFGAARDNVLNTLIARQPDVWYYRFDWAQEPEPWNRVYGAAHLVDVEFVFASFGEAVFSKAWNSKANEGGRVALASAMMASLGAFARTGDPNNDALPVRWQPWPAKVIFDASASEAKISAQ